LGGKVIVLSKRISKLVILAGTLGVLVGCQSIGPIAIDQGRDRYNSIIQSTSKVQTLSNVVRVYNHEPITVMDVTEVDAAQSISGGVNGGLTNIGATATKSTSAGTLAGQVGNVSANGQYSEIPTIRYQPLLGQALVAQLVTPVSADALGLLYDSSWNVSPLLDLASSYLTLDYSEFHAALNIISELHSYGALELVAAKSELTKARAPTSSKPAGQSPSGNITLEVSNKPAGNGANDALQIYLQPFHRRAPRSVAYEERRALQLWARLLWLYHGTQPKFTPRNPASCAQIGLSINPGSLRNLDIKLRSSRQGLNLDGIRNCLPNFIELRTASVPPQIARSEGLVSGAPLMRTYSALGILKNATERPHPKIAFVSPEVYGKIRSYPWNQEADRSSSYTLLPETEDPLDNPISRGREAQDARINEEVTNWIQGSANDLFVYEPTAISDDDYIRGNRRLGLLRRYILIVVSDGPPLSAYVAHFSQGKWYYIDSDDAISQKNFDLISLFLTMMAIPSAVPPLSPTINVGGM
jgi:hypothetical protein